MTTIRRDEHGVSENAVDREAGGAEASRGERARTSGFRAAAGVGVGVGMGR